MVAPSLLPSHTGERIGRDLTPKHHAAAHRGGRVPGAPEDVGGCGHSERHQTTLVKQNTTSDTAPSIGNCIYVYVCIFTMGVSDWLRFVTGDMTRDSLKS